MVQQAAEGLDPRVRRTRQMLQQALEKLLKIKGFDEISVQDIADAATVNRATFYDHYCDRFSLLECMVAERFDELLTERKVQYGTCASDLIATVLAVCEYLMGVMGPSGERVLEPRMESAIIGVLQRLFLDGVKRHPRGDAAPPEIVAATVSWAIYGASKEWARMPDRRPPEEIAAIIANLVAPILQLPAVREMDV
jgi:AcrR family transcriptional regulator